jgi:hypothetical protein
LCGKKIRVRVFCKLKPVVKFSLATIYPAGGPERLKYGLSTE